MIIYNFNEIDRSKKPIIYTQGVFDLLHYGHINYLNSALDLGKTLIIGLDSDEKVKHRKGDSRPIQNWNIRAENLINSKLVNYVFKKHLNVDSLNYINLIKPDYIVIPSEYKICIKRKKYLEDHNIKLISINRSNDISTTKIIEFKKCL